MLHHCHGVCYRPEARRRQGTALLLCLNHFPDKGKKDELFFFHMGGELPRSFQKKPFDGNKFGVTVAVYNSYFFEVRNDFCNPGLYVAMWCRCHVLAHWVERPGIVLAGGASPACR